MMFWSSSTPPTVDAYVFTARAWPSTVSVTDLSIDSQATLPATRPNSTSANRPMRSGCRTVCLRSGTGASCSGQVLLRHVLGGIGRGRSSRATGEPAADQAASVGASVQAVRPDRPGSPPHATSRSQPARSPPLSWSQPARWAWSVEPQPARSPPPSWPQPARWKSSVEPQPTLPRSQPARWPPLSRSQPARWAWSVEPQPARSPPLSRSQAAWSVEPLRVVSQRCWPGTPARASGCQPGPVCCPPLSGATPATFHCADGSRQAPSSPQEVSVRSETGRQPESLSAAAWRQRSAPPGTPSAGSRAGDVRLDACLSNHDLGSTVGVHCGRSDHPVAPLWNAHSGRMVGSPATPVTAALGFVAVHMKRDSNGRRPLGRVA